MAAVDGGDGIHISPKHHRQARSGRACVQLPRSRRQPALHAGLPNWIRRQPKALAVLVGEVHQDRIGVGQYHAVVINRRYLAKAVDGGDEIRGLLGALLEVHQDELRGQA